MIIKVLGSGCANCKKLEGLAAKAVTELGIEAEIVKVTDMSTPALVIDEELKVAGRVPSYDDVVTIIKRAM
mgnify:CR=1 FL=1